MRVIVSGGGTGGHIYPALAISAGLKKQYPETKILYVGTNQGLEADLVPQYGYNFVSIPSAGLRRQVSLSNINALWQAGRGYWAAKKIIKDFQPDVVIGTGGYVSGPIVYGAVKLGVKTVIHEQNVYPGLTNKILTKKVSRVLLTFEETREYLPDAVNYSITGLPVRPEILNVNREKCRKSLGVNETDFVILSFGGSRGARRLNQAIPHLSKLVNHYDNWRHFHAAGSSGYEELINMFREQEEINMGSRTTLVPYYHDMATMLGAADLVVCRAGASTVAELTAAGLPSILIPYPYATANHQGHNALSLVKQGAAKMILDRDLTGPYLGKHIEELYHDEDLLMSMRSASQSLGKPKALEDIVQNIVALQADDFLA